MWVEFALLFFFCSAFGGMLWFGGDCDISDVGGNLGLAAWDVFAWTWSVVWLIISKVCGV